MGLIIEQDGTLRPVQPANGKFFTLKELQAAVHGYIEVYQVGAALDMYGNEEARFDAEMAHNSAASAIARLHVEGDIVGPVILVPTHQTSDFYEEDPDADATGFADPAGMSVAALIQVAQQWAEYKAAHPVPSIMERLGVAAEDVFVIDMRDPEALGPFPGDEMN